MVQIQRILVPVDGSDGSGRAVQFAQGLAQVVGARVTWLYVFDAPAIAELGIAAKGDRSTVKDWVAQSVFERLRAHVGAPGSTIHEHVEMGQPWEKIVRYAASHATDMIVMGARGLSPVRQLVLGSVSQRVVGHAPCPVVIVRP